MVWALLAGRKTQTRRIIKPQPPKGARYSGVHYASDEPDSWFFNTPHGGFKVRRTYEEGDWLYVRENWRPIHSADPSRGAQYRADVGFDQTKWKPSIHMPRWASRLTLIVTGAKVERLQDISDEDAVAEGVIEDDGEVPGIWYCPGGYTYGVKRHGATPAEAFRYLWEAINGPDAWDANPWVVAVSFSVHRCNIDQMPEAA